MSERSQAAVSGANAGFTLLEIMVALTVGGIAISSIYALGSASTRHFREQQRVSATQTSLRSAMDQVKHDFQRAGFLASRNIATQNDSCVTPLGAPLDDASGTAGTGRLAAISTYSKGVAPPSVMDPDRLNGAPLGTVDSVLLMGNYATSGEYSPITVAADAVTITFPILTQSFQRDFADWDGATAMQCNSAAFANAFAIGRMVRLHSLTERNFFSRIASVDCPANGPAKVVLTDRIPNSCSLNAGWIAPVSTMWLHADNASGAEASRFGDNRVAVLRRTEMQPQAKGTTLKRTVDLAEVNVEDRSILDYLVQFNIDFMLTGAAGFNSVDFVPAPAANVRGTPENARGVIITLAARTPEQEPNFFQATAADQRAFKVLATQGAARVRRLRAEVLLQNVAP